MRRPFHIDLHVHTSHYSECAETLDPSKIEEYARKVGLHAVVITEHDTLWDKEDLNELQRRAEQILFFNGVEVTTQNGSHLVVMGIDELGPLQKGIPSHEAVEYAHAEGGIVYLAHPFRTELPPHNVLEKLDAIEIGSTSFNKNESALALNLADKYRKPAIACSDAHALPMIGWAYTLFRRPPEDIHQLCAMIKEGMGKAVLPNSFAR